MSARTIAAGLAALALALPFLRGQFKSQARLVEVYATVYDRQNHPVDGLEKDRFQIFDNGLPQPVVSFESTTNNLTCAILLDTTGSMRDTLGSVRNAVSNFLDQFQEGDSAGVFAFNTALIPLQDFTTDKAAAKRAVQRIRAAGQTALFDAVAQVSLEIQERPGKKVIVLFTDGADNASQIISDAAVARVLKTGVPIYAVAEGDATRDGALRKLLKSMADRTGGEFYQAHSGHDVATVFLDIQARLKHVYLISYRPPPADETKWRTIEVRIAGAKDLSARGRQGYFPN